MPIGQFEQMIESDRSEYLTRLVMGSIDGLMALDKKTVGDKVDDLFSKGNGAAQCEKLLDALQAANTQNAANPNHKETPFTVEDAFALTLKQSGILVPLKYLLAVNRNFKPRTTLTY